MFKRILVAVDGSPTSNRGLETALALASDQLAKVYAVHVVDEAAIAAGSAMIEYTPPDYVQSLWDSAREQGHKLLHRAQALAARRNQELVPILVESVGGGVAPAILAQARDLHADLIVLGTHGRRGLRRIVMGSDAENVVREARLPVLLVHSPHGKPLAGNKARKSRGMRVDEKQAVQEPAETA